MTASQPTTPIPQELHDEIVTGLAQLIADAKKRQGPAWGAL